MTNIPPHFTSRNERIRRNLERDPDHAAEVAAIRAEMDAADRAYRMQLAAVRQAGHLTQTELAARLGVNQTAVSKAERRTDMLYSTLLAYLEAAGASNVRLVAQVAGHDVEIELATAAVDD